MPARGVAQEKDPICPAAILGDMLLGPGNGLGHVVDVRRMAEPRREPVVRRHHADALPGETSGHLWYEIERLVAPDPGAAVDEYHDGEILGIGWQIEVQEVAESEELPILQATISHVPAFLHLEGLAGRCWPGRGRFVGPRRGGYEHR